MESACRSDPEESVVAATGRKRSREPLPKQGESSDESKKRRQDGSCANSDDDSDDDCWTEAIHRFFVEAIYRLGVKHSSPSIIMENMANTGNLTSERVKSHLQKYRNNRKKSAIEFMMEYNAWMQKALTIGVVAGGSKTILAPPATVMNMMEANKLLTGGDAAAFVTYASMFDKGATESEGGESLTKFDASSSSPDVIRSEPQAYEKLFSSGAQIPLPVLTPEEKRSPLGVSIGHVIAIFGSMTQHLMKEREANQKTTK